MSHTGCEEQGNLLMYGKAALSYLPHNSSCAMQVTGNLQAVQNGLAAICAQLRINPGKAWSEPISVSLLTACCLITQHHPALSVLASFYTPVKPVLLTAEHAQP